MELELEEYKDQVEKWANMEEGLKKLAIESGTETYLLEKEIDSCKPPQYWLSRLIPSEKDVGGYAGNFLHLAAWHGKASLVETLMSRLPEDMVSLILCQQEIAGDLQGWNPLHVAVYRKEYRILEKMVNWIWKKGCPKEAVAAQDSQGRTPALLAIDLKYKKCAEILTKGEKGKLIQGIVDNQGNSPLFLALNNHLDGVVSNLLNCPAESLCGTGPNDLTALHISPQFSFSSDPKQAHDEKLFEKLEEQITVTDNNGFTLLHKWIEILISTTANERNFKFDYNKVCRWIELFEWFFKSYPDNAVELMRKRDITNGNNPLHLLVMYAADDVIAQFAEQLIRLYKEYSKVAKETEQPWLMKNENGDTPLVSAIRRNRQKLASCFLSADPEASLCLAGQTNPFILAAYHQNYPTHPTAKEILAAIKKYNLKSLLPFDDECPENILELAYLYPTIFIEEVKEKLQSEVESNLRDIKLGRYSEYKVLNVEIWDEMNEELKEAACSGNASIFRGADCVYWLRRLVPTPGSYVRYAGNIFHVAAWHGQALFLNGAIRCQLPVEVLHLLLSRKETAGELDNWNPLHVAVHRHNHSFVEMIVTRIDHDELFMAQDNKGRTPALLAAQMGDSISTNVLTSFRLEPLFKATKPRVDLVKDIVDYDGNSLLFLAVKNGLHEVVSCLLRTQGSLPATGPTGLTVLHVAPGLSDDRDNQDEIYERLFERFSGLTTERDNDGFTLLHKWVEISCNAADNRVSAAGLTRLFKYFFDKHRADAITFMLDHQPKCKDGNNPLHFLAASSASKPSTFSESMAVQIATQLVDLYKTSVAESPNVAQNDQVQPWLKKNDNGHTPFLLAIHHKLQDLASCFLHQDVKNLLKASSDQQNPLLVAAQSKCDRLVAEILGIIATDKSLAPLLTFSDKSNFLHLALDLEDPETVVEQVVKNFPQLINERDRDGDTPLDMASKSNAAWAVELMLKNDPLSLDQSNNGWKVACQKGHVRVVLSLLKHCSHFRGFCLGRRDTPLHYIQLHGYADYQSFVGIHKVLEELRNTKDNEGNTPLHKAIRNNNIDLAEALLTMKDVRVDIKNKDGKTAMDLLVDKSKDENWKEMCARVEIDPTSQTTYVQRRADLLKIREVVIVVAALLATITFQAGFTLPGGLDNNTGEALLAKRVAFLVFLIADVAAMCCSILVLFCLIWSMFCDSSRSMIFIDRSMIILLISLFASLVAFMAGVFLVISDKALWAAIFTIVACSLVGISAADKGILYVLLKIMPVPKTENGPLYDLLAFLGKACTSKKNDASTNSGGVSNGQQLPL